MSNPATSEFIVETEQIKRAVEVINTIENDKFPLLLQRIALKIHSNSESSFKPEEIDKLEKSLGLNNEKCVLIIEILEFIYLQAAYELIKPINLYTHLIKLKLDETKATQIAEIWKENGKEIMEKIRKSKSLMLRPLTQIKWKLNLQLANESKAKQKLPNAVFEFNIENKSSYQPKEESIQVEFGKEQLYDFFSKLELIQKQIDSLNS